MKVSSELTKYKSQQYSVLKCHCVYVYVICRQVNVSLPASTLSNGSLYAHVFLGPVGKSPSNMAEREHLSWSSVPLTKYAIPQSTAFNLLSNSNKVWGRLGLLTVC